MKKMTRSIILSIIIAVSLIAMGCQSKEEGREKDISPASSDNAIANLKVRTLSGTETYIHNIFAQAELTVVNIWSPDCEACEDEMAVLGSLGRQYAGRGVQVLGIVSGVTQAEDADTAAMADSADADYTQVLDSSEIKKTFYDEAAGLPYTLFIDRSGEVLGRLDKSGMTITQWEDEIEKYHSQVCTNDHPADCGVG